MRGREKSILEHMLEDALDAISFAEEISSLAEFSANKLYRKAVIMSILNIGELAKKLSHEFRETYDEIPWKKIIGMRDIAANGYHEMDDDIIWDVVKHSLPELACFIKNQLENHS